MCRTCVREIRGNVRILWTRILEPHPPESLLKKLRRVPREESNRRVFWVILSLVLVLMSWVFVQNFQTGHLMGLGDFLVQMPKNMQRYIEPGPDYSHRDSETDSSGGSDFIAQAH